MGNANVYNGVQGPKRRRGGKRGDGRRWSSRPRMLYVRRKRAFRKKLPKVRGPGAEVWRAEAAAVAEAVLAVVVLAAAARQARLTEMMRAAMAAVAAMAAEEAPTREKSIHLISSIPQILRRSLHQGDVVVVGPSTREEFR